MLPRLSVRVAGRGGAGWGREAFPEWGAGRSELQKGAKPSQNFLTVSGELSPRWTTQLGGMGRPMSVGTTCVRSSTQILLV